jgi:hypothetical protein
MLWPAGGPSRSTIPGPRAHDTLADRLAGRRKTRDRAPRVAVAPAGVLTYSQS